MRLWPFYRKDQKPHAALRHEAERWWHLVNSDMGAAQNLAQFNRWLASSRNMEAFEQVSREKLLAARKNQHRPLWHSLAIRPLPALTAMALLLALAALIGPNFNLYSPGHSIQVAAFEWRNYSLDDGSKVHFGPGSQASISTNADQRNIQLGTGTVIVTAAPNAARPLKVTTPHGEVLVVGTQFTVFADSNTSEVAVSEGKVLVNSSGIKSLGAFLTQDQTARITDQGIVRIDHQVESRHDLERGWRSFKAASLKDAITALARHNGKTIYVSPFGDPRISGRINLNDFDQALDLLAQSSGTRVQALPFGVTFIY